MTKKHFIALAQALANRKPVDGRDYVGFIGLGAVFCISQWERDVRAIADVCETQSDTFDRARFMLACGLIEG